MITKEEAEKAYQELVQLRRSEVLGKSNENPGKIEIHHIIPISCNGEDVDENKIALYAKEHFMAHVYLWIIHHDDEFHDQTLCALNLMIKGTLNGNRQELRDFILASEEYQKAREEFAKLMSQTIGSKISGEKNGMFGKHWYKDPNDLSCHMFNEGEQPDDWIPGKYQQYDENYVSSLAGKMKICKKDFSQARYVYPDEAKKLIESGEWEIKVKPVSEQARQNIKAAAQNRDYSYLKGLTPKNKNKTKLINTQTNEIIYIDEKSIIPPGYVVANGNVICCINVETKKRLYLYKDNPIPNGYVSSISLNKRRLKKLQSIKNQKREEYIKETQEMADYYTKYGFEATCKKFPGRSGTCSVESMIMRFIRCRRLYGITFVSQVGKPRTFEKLS